MKVLAAGIAAIVGILPIHVMDGDKEGPICDRFSVCFICDNGTCILPGLPELPLPKLPIIGGEA